MAKSTAASKRHLQRVRELGCVICGGEANAHHKSRGAGMGLRSSDYDTFPLCHGHHQNGGLGVAIHAGLETWEKEHGTETEWIAETRVRLGILD